MNATANADFVAACLEPFPSWEIDKLPKGGTTLDYVSHARVTRRLLELDPTWNWQPMAYTPQGLPQLDDKGGLWIWLTVAGVTRIGYGEAVGGFTEADKLKSAIGDAIRNAAMRFGVALALWESEPKLETMIIDLKQQLVRAGFKTAETALAKASELAGRSLETFDEINQSDFFKIAGGLREQL